MHGILKVKTTAEQQELKQKEHARKLAAYRTLVEKITLKRKQNQLDDEILKLTGQVLVENPDIYTFWNIRKETILHIEKIKPEEINDYIEKELSLTKQCLRVNPKSYNTWFHRSWVLDHSSQIDYANELKLCNMCLKADERNFHCWDYRRIIVQKSGTPAENELEFSTEKINDNFSNYSAWHYRTKLLPHIYPSNTPETCISADQLSKECTLVQNAVFTDPSDQSAWFYHRWLLFSRKSTTTTKEFASVLQCELESCQHLLDLEPNNKWCLLRICELLRRMDSIANESEILELIDKLRRVDPLRTGYYTDWRSQLLAENELKKTSSVS